MLTHCRLPVESGCPATNTGDESLNCFVLCCGRVGSVAFYKACSHCENYTVGHESRAGICGPGRFDYPDDHIEIDNRLSHFLGAMELLWPNAHYVHLQRNWLDTAKSFEKRTDRGIMKAFGTGILMGSDASPLDKAKFYVSTVNTNISRFMERRPKKTFFEIRDAERLFGNFWRRIGMRGDLEAAVAEFGKGHNAS